MVRLHIDLHHLIDFVRTDSPGDRHAQRIAHEIQRVVVFQKLGVFGEKRAFPWIVNISLEFRKSLFTSRLKDRAEHRQRFHIKLLVVARPGQRARRSRQNPVSPTAPAS